MSQKKNVKPFIKNPLFENLKDEKLLTKQELAEFLQVSVKTIDKWVSLNEIPYFKVGRLVRFSKERVIVGMSKGLQAG